MKKQAKYLGILFSLMLLFSFSSAYADFGGLGGGWALPNAQGLPTASITNIVRGILIWILSIIGVVAIIGFAVSGIMYLISAGNDKMIEKAKSAMMASIIGVIVALSGYIVIRSIDAILNARVNSI